MAIRFVPLLKSALMPALIVLALFCAAGARAQIPPEIKVATDDTYPPFEFLDHDHGDKLVGFDVDLVNEIGKQMGVRIRWIPMAWNGVVPALQAHKCDIIMSGVTITAERRKSSAFSRPYFLSGQSIAKRKGDTSVQGLNDLKDKTVAVQEETTGQYALTKIGVPKDHMLKFDKLPDALLDVRNGRAVAVVADDPALKYTLRLNYPDLELLPAPFNHEDLGVWMRKGEPDLLDGINRAIETIFVSGKYDAMYRKWFGTPLTTGAIAQLYEARGEGTSTAAEIDRLAAAPPQEPSKESASGPTKPRFSFDWRLIPKNMPFLLRGARMTLALAALALLIGIPLGLLLALGRISTITPLSRLSFLYVEVFRGTPLLAQIYVIYFVVPAFGPALAGFTAAIIALALNAGAYISEIFRAGIESIDTGQMEAARALGMTYRTAMRYIILPQTIRRVLPPLTNEGVALLKDTSLVSVIALNELTRVGFELATDKANPVTFYLTVAVIYLIMTTPLTWLVRKLERRFQFTARPATAAEKGARDGIN